MGTEESNSKQIRGRGSDARSSGDSHNKVCLGLFKKHHLTCLFTVHKCLTQEATERPLSLSCHSLRIKEKLA